MSNPPDFATVKRRPAAILKERAMRRRRCFFRRCPAARRFQPRGRPYRTHGAVWETRPRRAKSAVRRTPAPQGRNCQPKPRKPKRRGQAYSRPSRGGNTSQGRANPKGAVKRIPAPTGAGMPAKAVQTQKARSNALPPHRGGNTSQGRANSKGAVKRTPAPTGAGVPAETAQIQKAVNGFE